VVRGCQYKRGSTKKVSTWAISTEEVQGQDGCGLYSVSLVHRAKRGFVLCGRERELSSAQATAHFGYLQPKVVTYGKKERGKKDEE
jgi:hypothetical protein